MIATVARGLSVNTVSIHVAGLRHAHRMAGVPCPTDDGFRAVMSGIRREHVHTPAAKAALTLPQLSSIVAGLKPSPRGVRNNALFVVGFASALRRSELSALDVRDVRLVAEGLEITIRRSKTDQRGDGRVIGIWPGRTEATCPVRTMQKWLSLRGLEPGPLFCQIVGKRILTDSVWSGEGMSRALKRATGSIGLDLKRYGGHSLRAGCITAAVKGGASVLAIMQRSGHRNVQTVYRYVRSATVFDVNPLKDVL